MGFELEKDYGKVLQLLKEKIRQARMRANHSVNKQLILLYHEIGSTILEQEKVEGWGAKVIDAFARDLKIEFPDMTGFSRRNLRYMKDFASAYSILQPPVAILQNDKNQEPAFLQPVVAQIPWTHHTLILDKLKTEQERLFYIQKTAENGWSKSVLVLQIENGLYQRQGRSINNFSGTLPAYQSNLAGEMFKNPYLFDFLYLGEEAKEKELEQGLIQHLKKFMLELGRGFAYVGNQFNLEVGGDDFFLDLLFYNTRLHCYVIFELKIGEFKPEYAGKLNFYLNTADANIKTPEDKPTIGILLCKTPNKTVVEYALRGIDKPMGIADFELKKTLPLELENELPTVKELEEELEKELQEFKESQSAFDTRLQAIKGKIKSIHTDVLQTTFNYASLVRLYKNGLRLLYTEFIEKVNVFAEDFYDIGFLWYCNNKSFDKLEDVDFFWKEEQNLKAILEFNFQVRLDGFIKAGTEYCNIHLGLTLKTDTYYYSLTVENQNNQKPFKKLYHQDLEKSERDLIIESMMIKALDDIDLFLEKIK